MSLVRILVDGYSLLHHWPELARGRARHSAAAREELIRILVQYQDATGTPVTVFFDGSGRNQNNPGPDTTASIEVLFSGAGQTADQLIERAAHRFSAYGHVLAVTNDAAERDTVIAMGGMACSCDQFIRMIRATLEEQQEDIKSHNRRERTRFARPREGNA